MYVCLFFYLTFIKAFFYSKWIQYEFNLQVAPRIFGITIFNTNKRIITIIINNFFSKTIEYLDQCISLKYIVKCKFLN